MAFRDFTFPEVRDDLGLTLDEQDLFSGVSPMELPAEFIERVATDAVFAVAIGTEKAKSEFIIAPVLSHLRRTLGGRFAIFSGVSFDVDAARGLNGYCDFLLARSPIQSVVTAPAVAIAEAKNDLIRNGLGQCIAAMVAAQEFNARSPGPASLIHGVVTTGSAWKFLRLTGMTITLDRPEHYVSDLPRILGILGHFLTTS